MPFNLETPEHASLTGITRFSGWYIPETSTRPSLVVTLNGRQTVALDWGLARPDVAAVFPQHPRSLLSAFQGDVMHSLRPGAMVEVEVVDRGDPAAPRNLYRKSYVVTEESRTATRDRRFDPLRLLRCPACRGPLTGTDRELACPGCRRTAPIFNQVPHFLEPGDAPLVRLTEQTSTHRYSKTVEDILARHEDGLILDFGAGNTPPDLLLPNVLYLDAVQYRATDVACRTLRLPFAEGSFDAIVSQSVFEHIPDPWTTAQELHRVLKPGGTILVDTAFMQPLHGDPGHYFNMTLSGLRRVLAPFKELRSGIQPHQGPDSSLVMQLDSLIPHVRPGPWKDRLEQWRRDLQSDMAGFNNALTEIGVETLSAGVFFLGTRA